MAQKPDTTFGHPMLAELPTGATNRYNHPTGTNNGQISSQVVSGETITYQYDRP